MVKKLRVRKTPSLLIDDICGPGTSFQLWMYKDGAIDIIPLDEGMDLILEYDGGDCKFWLFADGEDWFVFKRDDNEQVLCVYWIDNWEFILKGLKSEKPYKTINIPKKVT